MRDVENELERECGQNSEFTKEAEISRAFHQASKGLIGVDLHE